MATLSVSALRRFSAISNDVRVRVLGSKNRLTTVRPRSVGTFLMVRWPTSFIASAVSRIEHDLLGAEVGDAEQVLLASAVSGGAAAWLMWTLHGSILPADHFVDAVELAQAHLHALLARRRHVLADVVGLDRQLAMAAIDEHHELNRLAAGRNRSARRARRASCARCRARRRRG